MEEVVKSKIYCDLDVTRSFLLFLFYSLPMTLLFPMRRPTFSSAPGGVGGETPAKNECALRYFINISFRCLSLPRCRAAEGRSGASLLPPSERAEKRTSQRGGEGGGHVRGARGERQRRTLYCNWGDILEILRRGNTAETAAVIQREVMTCWECREEQSGGYRIRPPKTTRNNPAVFRYDINVYAICS